jgi:hypothetical protein
LLLRLSFRVRPGALPLRYVPGVNGGAANKSAVGRGAARPAIPRSNQTSLNQDIAQRRIEKIGFWTGKGAPPRVTPAVQSDDRSRPEAGPSSIHRHRPTAPPCTAAYHPLQSLVTVVDMRPNPWHALPKQLQQKYRPRKPGGARGTEIRALHSGQLSAHDEETLHVQIRSGLSPSNIIGTTCANDHGELLSSLSNRNMTLKRSSGQSTGIPRIAGAMALAIAAISSCCQQTKTTSFIWEMALPRLASWPLLKV